MKKSLLTFLLTTSAAFADDLPALNNRLMLDVPEEAQYGQRTTALMEADPADTETLIWIGEGADRIAIYAQELDVSADADFDTQAQKILKNRSNKVSPDFDIKKLNDNIWYAVRTTAPTVPNGADLYGEALIRHTDNTLIRVSMLFAPNLAPNAQQCREYVEKIFTGMRIGQGVREASARTDKINFFNEMELQVEVPEHYVRTVNPGCDFIYTTYTRLAAADAPTDYFGIYLGGHPSFEKREDAKKTKSTTAGKKVTWYCYEPEPEVYAAECCVRLTSKLNFDEPPVFMHLIIIAPSDEARSAQIEQLSKIKRKKAPARANNSQKN